MWYVLVCMQICTAGVHMCVQVSVYVNACGGLKLVLGIFLNCCLLLLERKGLSSNPEFAGAS